MTRTFSFIIPHKNNLFLLKRCVDSIPNREDIQIIIVDDNSDPSIVDFGEMKALESKNIEIYLDKSGLGAGHARNIGLQHAEGEWLLFADADDYYSENILSVIDKYKDERYIDLVILSAQKIDEKGEITSLSVQQYIKNYKKRRIYSEKVLRYGVWTPWTRMVRRQVVLKHKLLFEEIPVGNDMMFCLNCSKYAKTIDADETIVYNYYNPTGRSLTEVYKKRIETIEPRVKLKCRTDMFYDSVNYIFKVGFLYTIVKSFSLIPHDRINYCKSYIHYLRMNDYSFFRGTLDSLVYLVGRVFKII